MSLQQIAIAGVNIAVACFNVLLAVGIVLHIVRRFSNARRGIFR
ncbi:hypothetical protein [Arenimonas oryziterrae]|uniref:Uncharacterized protein n=1 Tax=Arenimonas oryziterrae DSM 21050 = YC6267 TaxID=1121015 RepID=A0A091ARZ5_9GAMM|nr:hypothetical protein [Arenimonas oryziterrae]KFN42146.1 hypothetical protein N789_14685 [Arenimonas oryziterrae DSM 21050 = YC6267]